MLICVFSDDFVPFQKEVKCTLEVSADLPADVGDTAAKTDPVTSMPASPSTCSTLSGTVKHK